MGDEYILANSIQGSFHQGNVEKFGDTAVRQYTCMALFAIAYASFKRLGIWQKCGLDVILMNGGQLCKSLDRTDYLRVIDLLQTFQVGSVQVNVEYNTNKYGTLTNGTVSTEELSEIFILEYFSGITFYIFLIHTAEIQQDLKLHQELQFYPVFLVMTI